MSAGSRNDKPPGKASARTPGKLRGKTSTERRGRGFRQVAASARSRLDAAASRQGFAEADVLIHWPDIVGESLAGLCHPVGVSYGRKRGFGATLMVRVEGARAPEAEMQAPVIVERINAHYGYRAISRMRLTQATGRRGRAEGFAEGLAEAATPFAGLAAAPPEPDVASVREAGAMARDIRDPALRDALSRMGAYVLSQSRGAAGSRDTDGPRRDTVSRREED